MLRRFMLLIWLALALPTTVAAQTTPTGQFLHLSDIHFDPLAGGDAALFNALNQADVGDWEQIFQARNAQAPASNQWQDSNYALLVSTLAAAQKAGKYDYVIHTGDYLAHGFLGSLKPSYTSDPAVIRSFTAKTVNFVNLMIGNAFPGLPLIATLGNNDSDCDDYQLTPGGDILAPVGADLPVVANDPAALADFKAGGYYRTPHPTVANVDFLVLSIFWSGKYDDGCNASAPDPAAAQMNWLTAKLTQQQASGRKSILLMHIPPGIDGFSSRKHRDRSPTTLWTLDEMLLLDFIKLTSQNKAQLLSGYAGHTHMDEFRVLADNAPYLAIRMAPSVTPYNGNRPSFTIFDYDIQNGRAKDYQVWTMNGTWSQEYRFSTAYGYAAYDPSSLQALAQRLTPGSKLQTDFAKRYAGGNYTPAQNPGDWPWFGCALTTLTAKPYRACVQGSGLKKGRGRSRN